MHVNRVFALRIFCLLRVFLLREEVVRFGWLFRATWQAAEKCILHRSLTRGG